MRLRTRNNGSRDESPSKPIVFKGPRSPAAKRREQGNEQ